MSLTFIAESASDDADALELASEIAAAHDCAGVFVWEPAAENGRDRFVGEIERPTLGSRNEVGVAGASAEA